MYYISSFLPTCLLPIRSYYITFFTLNTVCCQLYMTSTYRWVMVTQSIQPYPTTFSQHGTNFQQYSNAKNLKYQDKKLADRLIDFLIEDLVQVVLNHRLEDRRIKAVNKLGEWGHRSYEINILTRIARQDPNLALRQAATNAIDRILSRHQRTK